MARFLLGKNAKFYFSDTLLAADNDSSENDWTVVGNVRDLSLSIDMGEADVTARDGDGWEQIAGTLKSGSLEFEMVWRPGDAAFAAVLEALLAGEEIALMALDQDKDTPGAQGLASNFTVTSARKGEELRNAQILSITAKPSSFTEWHVTPEATTTTGA